MDLSLKKFYKNKKVLITGHTGFKGSWLSIFLKYLGAKIYGVSLKNRDRYSIFNQCGLEKRIKSKYVDISYFDNLESIIKKFKPDIIFHLAAQSLVIEGINNPKYTFENNINSTINVLEILKKYPFINSSLIITSDKVYKKSKKSLNEFDELGGIDPYSASKSCCELIINSYRTMYKTNGLRYCATARAGNVIGGGDNSPNRLVPDIFRSVRSKKVLTIRNPNHIRPWQHIFDPLYGYLILVKKNFKSGKLSDSWNFGPKTSHHKTVKDVVNSFSSLNNNFKLKFYNNNNYSESNCLKLNSFKAKKYLNWQSKFSFSETIKLTADQYQARRSKDDMYLKYQDDIKKFLEI